MDAILVKVPKVSTQHKHAINNNLYMMRNQRSRSMTVVNAGRAN